MPQHITSHDRFLGCLAGLAVGDAVGTSLEFMPPGSFAPLTDMLGGGPFGLEPGQWTDDTSMALCLVESLVVTGSFDPRDQMERYLRWYREGYWSSTGRCFDIGNTVRTALRRFEATGEPFAGSSDPRSAGNGSLMRLAPVVLFAVHDPARALHLAGESSRTTHGARAAIDACRFFAGLLVGALQGASKATLLAAGYSPQPGYWAVNPLDPDITEIANGSFKTRQPPEIRGTGYVVQSLEAALWAFYHGRDFREGCLLAANLGDDADTTAAIYGQLAGAFYGLPGIPATWLAKLARREEILGLAQQLAEYGLQGINHDDQTPA
jgi:ADP-ribosyl-[dinitrogen reductase] hydrolase